MPLTSAGARSCSALPKLRPPASVSLSESPPPPNQPDLFGFSTADQASVHVYPPASLLERLPLKCVWPAGRCEAGGARTHCATLAVPHCAGLVAEDETWTLDDFRDIVQPEPCTEAQRCRYFHPAGAPCSTQPRRMQHATCNIRD